MLHRRTTLHYVQSKQLQADVTWRQTCSGWQAAPSTINAATRIVQLHLLFLPRQKLIHGTRCATHSTDWPMSQRQVSTIWWDHLYVSITATSDNWAAAVIVLSFDRLTSRRKVTTLTASRRYTASCMSSHCHSVSGEYYNTALSVYDRWLVWHSTLRQRSRRRLWPIRSQKHWYIV